MTALLGGDNREELTPSWRKWGLGAMSLEDKSFSSPLLETCLSGLPGCREFRGSVLHVPAAKMFCHTVGLKSMAPATVDKSPLKL